MAFNPLGQATEYKTQYDPALLYPIARAESRNGLGIASDSLPFFGVDVWTGYELSWLDESGKPQVAVAEFFIPCSSEFIVESKSFKLYLNSFNQTRLASVGEMSYRLAQDLSQVTRAEVRVMVYPLGDSSSPLATIAQPLGTCIDEINTEINEYSPNKNLLRVEKTEEVVEECLYSHLLKTNCPVTGQPDWATLIINYHGKKIDQESLLKFVVSYREHQDFHEHCVESIYMAIKEVCNPEQLSVVARYTRRGGLDINPLRSSSIEFSSETIRLVRQ